MVLCFLEKTEELLRRLKRAKIAKLKVAAYKPNVDVRYNEKKLFHIILIILILFL